ncbi:THAP domain-containing protein 6-like [Cyprinus carpio]|uniref:THAP domain-containing protein 6-like n=1 Tax=Cyprinus carpio TaxID=7962 RepID=A0A9Q9VX84_CYPCA|nr:THAP domain-containing protein 6-like [Cyprinus carpio]
MPVFCAAYGCNNRRSIETRSHGITFHKFPSDTGLRSQWEVAIRREGFVVTESSKLCSEHFKPDDFDRTGQIVRFRDGATPSVFNFPCHLQRPVVTRNTKTSRKAEESLPVDLSQHFPESEPSLVQRMCSYLGSTLQKPSSELRTIISCLCHLWCLYFTK